MTDSPIIVGCRNSFSYVGQAPKHVAHREGCKYCTGRQQVPLQHSQNMECGPVKLLLCPCKAVGHNLIEVTALML